MKKKNQFWIILLKVLLAIFIAIVLSIGVFALVSWQNHKSRLEAEKEYLVAPGQMVLVDGHNIHVVHKGNYDSERTLVFLHANKSADESIAIEPLFEELSDYNLVYVDRSGNGFSEDWGASKDVASMVEETRTALKAVTDKKTYILVACKDAGVEAIYWANEYPDEVELIIGLNMYFPEQYSELDDDQYATLKNRILVKAVSIGMHRYASKVYPQNDASIYTDLQMRIRSALISKGMYTESMYNEDAEIVKNARLVAKYPWLEELNMYLIYSNPFMDPYLHENTDMLEISNQVKEQGEEYDSEKSYNDYYRTLIANHKNVSMEELSGPERIIAYNPKQVGELIKKYIESMY